MNQFTFEARQKTVLLGGIGLGVLCMILTFLVGGDDELHTRFWSNYLHNTVFFTGIGFIALFIIAAFITAWSGWHVLVKRVWEAYSLFMIPGLILMLVLVAGVWGDFVHLYHWTDIEAVEQDAVLSGKSSFLNKYWYALGTIIVLGVWIFFALKLRQLSVDEDTNGTMNFEYHHRQRIWAAAFLPIAGFASVAMVIQWIMSIDAHWYSTLFAWYTMASWFVACMALTIMTVVYLKSLGYLERVTANHLHDLGKYLFAISIFWTYLWFSQYMLIWYGNVGEETVYFQERINNYPVLFYGNLVLNFVMPFFILMRNDTKRKYGTMVLSAIIVFLGHWWDFFLMIKPGAYHTAHEVLAHHGGDHGGEAAHHAVGALTAGISIPGLLEFGTMIGFLSLFLYVVFQQMSKAPLIAERDPYMKESMTHHVWPF